MSPSRTTFMSIAALALAVAAPFSGAASTASATASATELGSPEPVESLQTLSHDASRETPANQAPIVIHSATVYAETADQVARVAWALGRFERLGLELPAFEVRYFADFSGCADPDDPSRERSYTEFAGDTYTIYMCGAEFTLLHELAHIWDVANLTRQERDRFLAERRLDTWKSAEWSQAGGEHLADVLAWGLQKGSARPSRTKPNDDTSLRNAFVLATGAAPLR